MMTITTTFIRGEAAAASKKKGHLSWKSQDHSMRQATERKSDFRSQLREGQRSSRFTPLIKTPKEILATEAGKFKPPPPMVTPVEKRSSNKFFDFYNDKGYSIDECMQLKNEITFPPLADSDGTKGPLVIEAEIDGHMIHRIYIDGGSSTEILYEHCFNKLRLEIRSQMVQAFGDNWRRESLYISMDGFHDRQFNIIGRPGIREIEAVPSIAYEMLKFHIDGRIVTIRSTILIPAECATVITLPKDIPKEAGTIMVKRHDDSWRMCVDFTDLNKACPQDCYPLPEIDWKIKSLCGYPFKCFLDPYKGYHQIEMAESDEEKMAFHTSQGVYCYTKMPFGLKNAGATYQGLVD
ncbi:hypothetical protein Tco_0820681 [Tanacetum coccineum]|uniref:Reverse transcriptase domain-containing protein n=1 Tax=Tanacetum coccineum TaxID=301880 RepID=A0ABQ5AD19_9ASTR